MVFGLLDNTVAVLRHIKPSPVLHIDVYHVYALHLGTKHSTTAVPLKAFQCKHGGLECSTPQPLHTKPPLCLYFTKLASYLGTRLGPGA